MSVGENIKQFRKLNSLSQAELAKKLGVSDKTISSWEVDRTEPDIGMIEKLANYFGCQKSDLIGDVKIDNIYYLNEDTRYMAQELFENKELRMLMDASKKLSKEDLKNLYNIVKNMKSDD